MCNLGLVSKSIGCQKVGFFGLFSSLSLCYSVQSLQIRYFKLVHDHCYHVMNNGGVVVKKKKMRGVVRFDTLRFIKTDANTSSTVGDSYFKKLYWINAVLMWFIKYWTCGLVGSLEFLDCSNHSVPNQPRLLFAL